MNSTTEVRRALRDLLHFHFGSYAWLPALLAAVAVGALAVLLVGIMFPDPGYVAPALAFKALICWAVSILSAYVGGFVMGRLDKRTAPD